MHSNNCHINFLLWEVLFCFFLSLWLFSHRYLHSDIQTPTVQNTSVKSLHEHLLHKVWIYLKFSLSCTHKESCCGPEQDFSSFWRVRQQRLWWRPDTRLCVAQMMRAQNLYKSPPVCLKSVHLCVWMSWKPIEEGKTDRHVHNHFLFSNGKTDNFLTLARTQVRRQRDATPRSTAVSLTAQCCLHHDVSTWGRHTN